MTRSSLICNAGALRLAEPRSPNEDTIGPWRWRQFPEDRFFRQDLLEAQDGELTGRDWRRSILLIVFILSFSFIFAAEFWSSQFCQCLMQTLR